MEDGVCGEGSDCAHTLGIPRHPWRLVRRSFLGIVERQLHAQQIPQKKCAMIEWDVRENIRCNGREMTEAPGRGSGRVPEGGGRERAAARGGGGVRPAARGRPPAQKQGVAARKDLWVGWVEMPPPPPPHLLFCNFL